MADASDFVFRYGPWALVTGGSEGVGAAWANEIAARGVNLLLLARRPEVLEATAERIRSLHGVQVEVAPIDVRSEDLIDRVLTLAADREVGLVVHNVGSVDRDHGLFVDDPVQVTVATVEVNCLAPAKLAHAFLPGMRSRRRGGFVIVGSLSAMAGQALEATYSAAKSFGQIFAEALWSEVSSSGVDVVCVPLGGTRTEALTAKGLLAGVDLPTASEVVAEAIEHLADGPVYVPVAANRRFFDKVTKLDRRDAVATMARIAEQWIQSQREATTDA